MEDDENVLKLIAVIKTQWTYSKSLSSTLKMGKLYSIWLHLNRVVVCIRKTALKGGQFWLLHIWSSTDRLHMNTFNIAPLGIQDKSEIV